jgi:hypothetical protein
MHLVAEDFASNPGIAKSGEKAVFHIIKTPERNSTDLLCLDMSFSNEFHSPIASEMTPM